MARKVVWSHQATADLLSIAEYISKDSAFYAAAFIEEALRAGRSLDQFYERGRAARKLEIRKYAKCLLKNTD